MKTVLFTNYRSSLIEREAPFQEAKKLGYTIVLTHPDPSKVPEEIRRYVDYFIKVDPNKLDEAIAEVKKFHTETRKIDGAYSWTDRDVTLVAEIGEELSLPTLPKDAALRVRNKYNFRQAVEHLGVCPKFRSVLTREDLRLAAREVGFPAIFKPVGASGSRAIFRVTEESNLDDLYEAMLEATDPKSNAMYAKYPNQYIYEGFLDGQEICVDGLVHDGEVHLLGVTDKQVSPEWSLETRSVFPSRLDAETQAYIMHKAREVILALNLVNAAFHLEARYSKEIGFKALECAGRPPGGLLASHVYSLALGGYPWMQRILQNGCRDERFDMNLPKPTSFSGIGIVFSNEEGQVTELSTEQILRVPGVVLAFPEAKVGDEFLLPPKSFTPTIACFVANVDSYEGLHTTLDAAAAATHCVLKPLAELDEEEDDSRLGKFRSMGMTHSG